MNLRRSDDFYTKTWRNSRDSYRKKVTKMREMRRGFILITVLIHVKFMMTIRIRDRSINGIPGLGHGTIEREAKTSAKTFF